MRQHRGGAIVCVAGLPGPETGHRDPALLAFFNAQQERVTRDRHRLEESVGCLVAAHLAHLFRENRIVLDPMSITVDDGMREFGADLLRRHVGVTTHEYPSGRLGLRATPRGQRTIDDPIKFRGTTAWTPARIGTTHFCECCSKLYAWQSTAQPHHDPGDFTACPPISIWA